MDPESERLLRALLGKLCYFRRISSRVHLLFLLLSEMYQAGEILKVTKSSQFIHFTLDGGYISIDAKLSIVVILH